MDENYPPVRQQFTIAHELGRCIFGEDRELFVDFAEADPATWTDDDRRRKLETKANHFAADVLLPRSWIRDDVRRHGLGVTLLAKRYEGSDQALWFRWLALRLIDAGNHETVSR